MRRLLTLVLVLALTAPVVAQRITRYEQLTVGATAVGITPATLDKMATCALRLEAAQVRWRADGTDPTTAIGTLMEIGDVLEIANTVDGRQVRFIRTGGTSGILNVNCFPQS